MLLSGERCSPASKADLTPVFCDSLVDQELNKTDPFMTFKPESSILPDVPPVAPDPRL